MDSPQLRARLSGLRRPLGNLRLGLRLGDRTIDIEGLDEELAAQLDLRWGGFVANPANEMLSVTLYRAGSERWLELPQEVEAYRLEAVQDASGRLVASYHFALAEEAAPGAWRVGLTEQTSEPLQRCVDNALRYVAACHALDRGGFALHAAGVLHEGRAYLLAGPSRAGKSTAVRLLAPAVSLGDDFAYVVASDVGWAAPALPFDNSERAPADPPRGLFPVAGIWRLHQAEQTRVESVPARQGVASLMGCTAFPWALSDRTQELLDHVEAFSATGGFRHLRFARNSRLWSHLVPGA